MRRADVDQLRASVAELRKLLVRLRQALPPSGGASNIGRVSGTSTPAAPLNLGVLDLIVTIQTDVLETEEELRNALSLVPRYGSSPSRIDQAVASFPALAKALGCEEEISERVHRWARDARAAVTLGESMPIGNCPAMVADDSGNQYRCDQPLRAHPTASGIACRSCKTYWPRDNWLLLGKQIREPEAS